MVFFIPGTDAKIFQGARRVFTFHIEIFSLLSELANSVMKRSKCEKWKLFKPLEKFKRKGLGWVICFLRLIEVYLYAIINYFNLPRKVDRYKQIIDFLSFLSKVLQTNNTSGLMHLWIFVVAERRLWLSNNVIAPSMGCTKCTLVYKNWNFP